MSKNLTEKQQVFLEVLFGDEAKGNYRKAMRMAGYSDNTPVRQLQEALAEEIELEVRKFLSG